METEAEQPGSVSILDLIRPPHGGPCARNAVSGRERLAVSVEIDNR